MSFPRPCLPILLLAGLLAVSLQPAAVSAVTGRAALTSALNAMARQRVFTTYLALLRKSGFIPVLANYIQVTPVTILAPTDAAFRAMPPRYKKQLVGPKLLRFLQYHMVLQLFPFAALRYFRSGAPWPTVLGPFAWKQFRGPAIVAFGPAPRTPVALQAQIVLPNVGGQNLRLVIVQGVNHAMIPPGVFA